MKNDLNNIISILRLAKLCIENKHDLNTLIAANSISFGELISNGINLCNRLIVRLQLEDILNTNDCREIT